MGGGERDDGTLVKALGTKPEDLHGGRSQLLQADLRLPLIMWYSTCNKQNITILK